MLGGLLLQLSDEIGCIDFDVALLLLLARGAPLCELRVLLLVLLLVREACVGCDPPFVLASFVFFACLCGCDARYRAGRMHGGLCRELGRGNTRRSEAAQERRVCTEAADV